MQLKINSFFKPNSSFSSLTSRTTVALDPYFLLLENQLQKTSGGSRSVYAPANTLILKHGSGGNLAVAAVVAGNLAAATDSRDYKRIILTNTLEVLLISDPDTDKCATSMNVGVGSFSDPQGLEGLAHFLWIVSRIINMVPQTPGTRSIVFLRVLMYSIRNLVEGGRGRSCRRGGGTDG